MSTTPFHDLADQMRVLADEVETLGDQVHTGTYTVPTEPPADTPPADDTPSRTSKSKAE